MMQAPGVSIASDELRVTVNPRVGGTITQVTHLASGLSVLGEVPWDPVDAPIASLAARDEAHWLTRFTGGWPLLFPNGGDACSLDGTFHGFHGEASIAPWDFAASETTIRLSRRFFSVPVDMEREFSLEGDLLIVRERLQMNGPRPIEVMWGHHVTFGSDLLSGPFEITTGALHVTVDAAYDPPANPLLPGGTGAWPVVPGKGGPVDLSEPSAPLACMAYMHGFKGGNAWSAITRLDQAIAAVLTWDPGTFPCAWAWLELGGSVDPPWYGRGRMVGIEPCTTRSAAGLADARARKTGLLSVQPGNQLSTELRLHVLQPKRAAAGVGVEGRSVGRA
jgi:hypothetical protein